MIDFEVTAVVWAFKTQLVMYLYFYREMSELSSFTILTKETFQQGISELCEIDADLADVIVKWGNPPFWINPTEFSGIVIAILAQQVSLESAQATFVKLEKAIGTISPEKLMSLKDDSLKVIGFSRQKISYVRGVANRILTGAFNTASLNLLDDDTIRKRLMEFKGIGPWTADVYLLFSLRRADAWPSGDLALEQTIKDLKGLPSKPYSDQANVIANSWRPWRGVAARILWHHYLCERGRHMPA